MARGGKKEIWGCRVRNRARVRKAFDRGHGLIDAEAAKRGGKCERCSRPYESRSRDFHWHHRDPATKYKPVALLAARTPAVLLAEIAKCDLLCRDCHYRNGLARLEAENQSLKQEIKRLQNQIEGRV